MTRTILAISHSRRFWALLVAVATMSQFSSVQAAISWDAGGNSHWWFDPVNWANDVLPPSNGAMPPGATDAQINIGTGAWDQGDGVVYDPANDPFFATAGNQTFPDLYGPQVINHLYMSRNTTNFNKLTIRGDLTFRERVHVGRSSGVRGMGTDALIVQEAGFVQMTLRELDIAQVDTSNPGYGNGVYDYRSGTLRVSQEGGAGLRLSLGSNSTSSDGLRAGPGGVGKFIVHNPSTPGYIRAFNVVTASYSGFPEPGTPVFDPMSDADGINTGVGIFEFHYENGGTRPIQVNQNLSLNNGVDEDTLGVRSSLLDFKVDSAACTGAACVPNNVGLFDVDFDGIGGLLLGSGDLDGDSDFDNDRVFSNITDTAAYREGDMVSGTFGGVKYNWTISYSGNITWTDADAGVVGSVTGMGTGVDIVLIGHSSESVGVPGDFDGDGDVDGRDFLVWQRNPAVGNLGDWQTNYGTGGLASIGSVPEPSSLLLLCAALPLLARRR